MIFKIWIFLGIVNHAPPQYPSPGLALDDLDVAELADLPLSVHDDVEEADGPKANAANLRNEKVQSAESNLLHIRHISAFVMSGLRDSSDSEDRDRDEAVYTLHSDSFLD